eukprot:TRINITY_DN32032_c0_g1_i1.p1 TRINITY_DN32032_c0_g1~~TRINITY_DN32032_c0_g1_i1.p1  ORF type:complete len:281 (+),score=72.47 TRINITY_DN32032_c0_g1_i1:134-976(+)
MANKEAFRRAAEVISRSSALVVTSGAGMGVDSGLPDFRGNEGLWNYYPPLRHLGVSFSSMANPRWFETDPELAWGFYGHRQQLYRDTLPNEGFDILKKWGEGRFSGNFFAFTSNVDGQFQKAGFPEGRVLECHGSIHHLQSTDGSGGVEPFPADAKLDIDMETLKVRTEATPLPTVSGGAAARPNILMFSDLYWVSDRTAAQEERFEEFLGANRSSPGGIAVVEVGAGMAVPTVRMMGEQLTWSSGASLIRINPDESGGGADVPLPCTGIEALRRIDALL